MSTLYHTGIVVGLIVVYLLATMGVGCLLTLSKDPDGIGGVVAGYVIGLVAFIFVTMELLEAKGYWDLPQSQIVEEIETEVVE